MISLNKFVNIEIIFLRFVLVVCPSQFSTLDPIRSDPIPSHLNSSFLLPSLHSITCSLTPSSMFSFLPHSVYSSLPLLIPLSLPLFPFHSLQLSTHPLFPLHQFIPNSTFLLHPPSLYIHIATSLLSVHRLASLISPNTCISHPPLFMLMTKASQWLIVGD